jgi:hypothetical protein
MDLISFDDDWVAYNQRVLDDLEKLRPPPSVIQPGLARPSTFFSAPVPAAAAPVPVQVQKFKLTSFWSHSPVLWFAQAEDTFELYGEVCSRKRYLHVVSSLDSAALKSVSDIVENCPGSGAYEVLKARLLAASKVSDYQKADRLMAMPPLGERRPSDMMSAMLDQCPRGWEAENFFTYLFMSRLPQNVRILLKGMPTTNLRLLAERADEIHGLHEPAPSVNSLISDSAVLCALAGKSAVSAVSKSSTGSGSGARRKPEAGGRAKKPEGPPGGRPPPPEPDASKKARIAAGFCLSCWRYGTLSLYCSKPCKNFSEN